jgi:thiol peroxidase
MNSMAQEHKGLVAFKGDALTLVGNAVDVGDTAPNFKIADGLADLASLSDSSGKVRVLNVVPSLDGSAVCGLQTRRMDKIAVELGDDLTMITVSMDLPPAQARWAADAEAGHVKFLSDYRDHSFGELYGVRIKELGILARSVWVVDRDGVVRYKQIVAETTTEPDYEPVIDAIKTLV